MRAGLDVDGCDLSPDMLAFCREKAEREGLPARLYQQALHELDLPRQYQTIVLCGVWGIGASRRQDFAALQRFYQHLSPGGALLLDYEMPYGDANGWQLWLKGARGQLPRPWPKAFGKRPPESGADYELASRVVALDPLEQRMTMQIRVVQWREQQIVADEDYTLNGNLYFCNELRLMLENAGFHIEAIRGAYTEAEATAEDDTLVFIARK